MDDETVVNATNQLCDAVVAATSIHLLSLCILAEGSEDFPGIAPERFLSLKQLMHVLIRTTADKFHFN